MSKRAAKNGLLAMAAILCCVCPAQAQVTVAQVLTIKPKSDDVAYTTPDAAEIGKCTVEVIKSPTGGSGYLLSDSQKRPLRKFLDTDADGRVDSWSYFRDGAEVYREALTGKGYTFRWIGQGGMKWGVGTVNPAGKAVVESWRTISAEEAAAEAFAALAAGDFDRMKALMISPQEIQALGLPAAEAQRIAQSVGNAPGKFQKVRSALPNLPKAKFSRLEGAQPGLYPADVTGGAQDIVKASGLILFENDLGPKKHDLLRANDMIQVGLAWRLTDVPGPEDAVDGGGVDPRLASLLTELAAIDGRQPPVTSDKFGVWTMERVQKVQEIAGVVKVDDKETWYKQIFDNLANAVANGDAPAAPILAKWKAHFETAMPGSNMAAYGAYREIWATFQRDMVKAPPAQLPKIQEKYHEALEKFIETYSKADDTPDAMIQLATGSEFSGKEDVAKKWYGAIVANFPLSHNAKKAGGAIRRIDSIGKAFELSGPTMAGATYKFSPGKIAVVYYWASYSSQVVGDFATFKKLQETYAKDLEVVTINLDDKSVDASAFLAKHPIAAQTLHQPGANGGMDSKLASDYGIFGLPHLFLIDQSGRVVDNKAQVNSLDDAIGRLLKK